MLLSAFREKFSQTPESLQTENKTNERKLIHYWMILFTSKSKVPSNSLKFQRVRSIFRYLRGMMLNSSPYLGLTFLRYEIQHENSTFKINRLWFYTNWSTSYIHILFESFKALAHAQPAWRKCAQVVSNANYRKGKRQRKSERTSKRGKGERRVIPSRRWTLRSLNWSWK